MSKRRSRSHRNPRACGPSVRASARELRKTMPRSLSARRLSTTPCWCTCAGLPSDQRHEARLVETLRRDGEVVELDHRVGLGPETDPPGLERIIVSIEDVLRVEPDDKMVAPGF